MCKKQIAAVTLFPEMFSAVTGNGITRRAIAQGLVEFKAFNPRDYATNKHRTVDDRPFGGGPGMVMQVEPLSRAVNAAQQWLAVPRKEVTRIYLSPQGERLDRGALQRFDGKNRLILIAGRYEGVDERFIETEVDEEWSIGDYVLSGGELPAMVLMDALIRKLPGALGDEQSAAQDSFEQGLLDCPHYTRPESLETAEFGTLSVPEVLLSGDHKKIDRWRLKQSLGRTWQRRPDLLNDESLTQTQQALLDEYLRELKK